MNLFPGVMSSPLNAPRDRTGKVIKPGAAAVAGLERGCHRKVCNSKIYPWVIAEGLRLSLQCSISGYFVGSVFSQKPAGVDRISHIKTDALYESKEHRKN